MRTYRHDEANSRFMQFCDRALKRWVSLQYVQITRRRRHVSPGETVDYRRYHEGSTGFTGTCNKRGELGCGQESRPGHCKISISLQDDTETNFKFCTFLSDQDLSNHTKWSVHREAPTVWYFLPHSCLQKLVMHLKKKCHWEPRLQWRYVHDWAISDITCWFVIVSYHYVVNTSLSCRPKCVSSNFKQQVMSFRKLTLPTSYRHRTWNSVQSISYLQLQKLMCRISWISFRPIRRCPLIAAILRPEKKTFYGTTHATFPLHSSSVYIPIQSNSNSVHTLWTVTKVSLKETAWTDCHTRNG